MSEDLLPEDSTGATEGENSNQDVTDQNKDAATTQNDESEALEVYDFEDFQASKSDIVSWREAHEAQQSKNKDYTQKTQALAEQRKQFDAKSDQIDQTLAFLQELQNEIDDLVMGDLKDIDLAYLIDTDPAEYERTRQKIEDRKQWKAKYQEKLNSKANELTAKSQEFLYKELDWVGNEDKFKQDSAAIYKYAQDAGITEKTFSKVTDPKIMIAFLEAQKYRELMSKKTAVTKELKKAPVVTKPRQSQSAAPKSLAQRMYPNMK